MGLGLAIGRGLAGGYVMSAGLRAGYKQTEVGVIPVDWEVRPLGEVTDFLDGRRRPVKDTDRAKMRGDIPYYGASGIVDYVNDFLFDEDLILLGEDGENILSRNRRLAFKVSGKAWVNNHAHVLRPKSGMELDYLVEFLESRNYEQYNTGTAQPKLNKQVCSALPVVCPTPPEQRAIAAALSDVDALLAGLDRLIAKKRDLKQAAMQQLLTGQTRLPGFQGEWHWKRMGDVCRITTGKKDVNQGNPAGQYPFFTCARDNTFSDSFSFDSEAILIAGNGEVGNLSYFKGKFEAYQRTYVLQDFSVGVTFLWHQLTAYLAASLGIGTIGSSIPYIKKGNLVNFEFKAPLDHGEQTAIAQVLSDMDAELTALQARRDKTCALKQAMMQELLTGKTRLV